VWAEICFAPAARLQRGLRAAFSKEAAPSLRFLLEPAQSMAEGVGDDIACTILPVMPHLHRTHGSAA